MADATLKSESIAHASEHDLWSQLRESMQRLSAVGGMKSDPVALRERLAARARLLRGRMTSDTKVEETRMILAFNKGSQRFGVLVNDVIEVQALDQFSTVPGTPAFIFGVIHWRGGVLSLLDLGKLFDLTETGIADVHIILIVEAAHRRVAIVANEIEEILSVPTSHMKPTPDLPGNIPAEWILGVHDNNRLILRPDQILQDARLVEWRQ